MNFSSARTRANANACVASHAISSLEEKDHINVDVNICPYEPKNKKPKLPRDWQLKLLPCSSLLVDNISNINTEKCVDDTSVSSCSSKSQRNKNHNHNLSKKQLTTTAGCGHVKKKISKVNVSVGDYGRRHFSLQSSTSSRRSQDVSVLKPSSNILESIRQKLSSSAANNSISTKNRRKRSKEKDPLLLAKIQPPVFISKRSSTGLKEKDIAQAQEAHKRKIMGWKYHQVSKAMEMQNRSMKNIL